MSCCPVCVLNSPLINMLLCPQWPPPAPSSALLLLLTSGMRCIREEDLKLPTCIQHLLLQLREHPASRWQWRLKWCKMMFSALLSIWAAVFVVLVPACVQRVKLRLLSRLQVSERLHFVPLCLYLIFMSHVWNEKDALFFCSVRRTRRVTVEIT